MDIHTPRAAHSWREFAIEIGTIICGVLIALGAEQTVEWLHRQTEVREAREALHQEIAADAAIAAFTIKENQCLLAKLDAYDAWSRGAAKPADFVALSLTVRSNNWETVKTGAVTHMPLSERLALANVYDWVASLNRVTEYERQTSLTLHGLRSRDRLAEADIGRLQEALTQIRMYLNLMQQNGRALIGSAAAMGIKPGQLSAPVRVAMQYSCSGGR